MAELLPNVLTAGFTILALALTLVAARAWRHSQNPKVLLLALGFALFLAKGLYYSIALFTKIAWEETSFLPGLAVDVVVLLVFYAAVLKRSGA